LISVDTDAANAAAADLVVVGAVVVNLVVGATVVGRGVGTRVGTGVGAGVVPGSVGGGAGGGEENGGDRFVGRAADDVLLDFDDRLFDLDFDFLAADELLSFFKNLRLCLYLPLISCLFSDQDY
jgi:hypothetical protein